MYITKGAPSGMNRTYYTIHKITEGDFYLPPFETEKRVCLLTSLTNQVTMTILSGIGACCINAVLDFLRYYT